MHWNCYIIDIHIPCQCPSGPASMITVKQLLHQIWYMGVVADCAELRLEVVIQFLVQIIHAKQFTMRDAWPFCLSHECEAKCEANRLQYYKTKYYSRQLAWHASNAGGSLLLVKSCKRNRMPWIVLINLVLNTYRATTVGVSPWQWNQVRLPSCKNMRFAGWNVESSCSIARVLTIIDHSDCIRHRLNGNTI